ncbi:MAG: ABC transporter ATP-binding protein [Acholeplasmataceae bacterium]|nr:ABC transporter ATP-binding protein [Acholeplasmataceae bacterium]
MKEMLLENKKMFTIYVLACFIPVVTQLLQMFTLAMIVETVERQTPEFFRLTIYVVIGFLILSALFFIVSRMMRIAFMRDILLKIRVRAFDKILNMNYRNFSKKSRDVYISNLMNDINTFENNFFLALINVIFRFGYYIVTMAILFIVNWQIGAIIFALSWILLGVSKLYEKKTIKLQEAVSTENEKLTVDISNTFNGLEILKLNNIEDKFLVKSNTQIKSLEHGKMKFNLFRLLQENSNQAFGTMIMFGLIILLMYRPDSVRVGYGELFLTITLASNSLFPLITILPLINTIKSSKAIFDKITVPDHIEIEKNGRPNQFVFNQAIEVKGLKFAYDQKTVFQSLDFTIEKGKKYLIKGPSGSGKSTLIKLLSMAYDEYEGDIKVDGIDLKDIKLSSFNDRVSYIYQDVFLFEATFMENIALFKDIDRSIVLEAAHMAGLKELIDQQPNGLDEMISENGKNLSGGERQRLSIARALCKKSEILFVDEATSALNDELGKAIEQSILNLDQTVIAISHKYFEGVTNHYDYVLEIKDGYLNQYPANEYFEGEA